MIVTPSSVEMFEDQLSIFKEYTVLNKEGCSLQIKNDNGEVKWYGCARFQVTGCSDAYEAML
jgi:hypothetical protein